MWIVTFITYLFILLTYLFISHARLSCYYIIVNLEKANEDGKVINYLAIIRMQIVSQISHMQYGFVVT